MKLLKIIIPCLVLGACVFGTSKNAKFYTPSAAAQGTVSTTFAGFVGINRIQLPKYLDRPQMVTQTADSNQVNVSEYNRWVESPAVLATRVLTDDLNVLLPAAKIKINQFRGEGFEKTVFVEITDLTSVLGKQAQMTAWYTLKNKTGKTIIQQKFTGSVQIGKTYDDVAQGYSQLLAQLSQMIANTLLQNTQAAH